MEWPSTGAGLGPSLVEAGLESGKMGNELVLGFTGMGLVQGKVGASICIGIFVINLDNSFCFLICPFYLGGTEFSSLVLVVFALSHCVCAIKLWQQAVVL